ncbi:hypothetical protein [Conexibacter sp. SYSU D00693]|uniref:hypothetical protein n=1 Tax=Conexibacter sp. SYSU D00693 TaxID=2812560 RepID=UPI00196B411E|nr:hypothetical protein [Conexibacter sp. SYSU D00693]
MSHRRALCATLLLAGALAPSWAAAQTSLPGCPPGAGLASECDLGLAVPGTALNVREQAYNAFGGTSGAVTATDVLRNGVTFTVPAQPVVGELRFRILRTVEGRRVTVATFLGQLRRDQPLVVAPRVTARGRSLLRLLRSQDVAIARMTISARFRVYGGPAAASERAYPMPVAD